MKTICAIGDNQGWVIDKIVDDFFKFTSHKRVSLEESPDIVWFVSLFDYFRYYSTIKKDSNVVVSVHHINESQINNYNFNLLSKVNICIVPNNITKESLRNRCKIRSILLPYWLMSSFLKEKDFEKTQKLRNELGGNNFVLIGSFIKDGDRKEGSTPKMSKGPDILLSVIEKLKGKIPIKIVLGGYARKYVVSGLERIKVPYVYSEKVEDVNLFYDILDWYLVTSRYEGGPQSILEASYRNIKILSTKVGIASDVLHPDCICNGVDDFVKKIIDGVDRKGYNYNNVYLNHLPQNVIKKYDEFFEKL